MDRVDVIVVGSGPAGLHAAIELHRRGMSPVVLERDAEAGGVPRWCHHHTFPCRVKKRLYTGPEYVRTWLADAQSARIPILTSTTVLRLDGDLPAVEVTSPRGPNRLEARAILLATGAREAHRHQRLVPGDRVGGVFTTASLFQWVYLNREFNPRRVVVFGSEDVSYSCVDVLLSRGCEVVAMVEPSPATRSWPAVRWYFERVRRVPHYFGVKEFEIHGARSVERVSFNAGNATSLACDAVVFTGGFTPNSDLIRTGNIRFNQVSRGPSINQSFQTSVPWVFAAGNCLRGVVSGDEAALEGRLAARAVVSYLQGRLPVGPEITVTASSPVYCCPDRLLPAGPGMTSIAFWPAVHGRNAELLGRRGERLIWQRRFRRVQPGRRIRIPLQELPLEPGSVLDFRLNLDSLDINL